VWFCEMVRDGNKMAAPKCKVCTRLRRGRVDPECPRCMMQQRWARNASVMIADSLVSASSSCCSVGEDSVGNYSQSQPLHCCLEQGSLSYHGDGHNSPLPVGFNVFEDPDPLPRPMKRTNECDTTCDVALAPKRVKKEGQSMSKPANEFEMDCTDNLKEKEQERRYARVPPCEENIQVPPYDENLQVPPCDENTPFSNTWHSLPDTPEKEIPGTITDTGFSPDRLLRIGFKPLRVGCPPLRLADPLRVAYSMSSYHSDVSLKLNANPCFPPQYSPMSAAF